MAGKHKYRLDCETTNKQNRLPCRAKGILMRNGRVCCKVHGGYSNGQTTLEGKVKAYKNLKQFKNRNDQEIRTYIRGFERNTIEVNGGNTSYTDYKNEGFS